jgi:hypothetical protein
VNSEELVGNGEIWSLENALVLATSLEFQRLERWRMVVRLAPSQALTCQVTGKRTHIRKHELHLVLSYSFSLAARSSHDFFVLMVISLLITSSSEIQLTMYG